MNEQAPQPDKEASTQDDKGTSSNVTVWGFIDRMLFVRLRQLRWPYRIVGGFIAVLGAAIFLTFYYDFDLHKVLPVKQDDRIVLLVLNDSDPVARDIRAGIDRESSSFPPGIKLETLDDGPTADATIARFKNQYFGKNGQALDRLLLVIGHTTSSIAGPMVRDFYAVHGIPVILPAVTSPSVTRDAPKSPPEKFCVLRLPPTDNYQATKIARLWGVGGTAKTFSQMIGMRTDHRPRAMVIADRGNKLYSNYLVEQLATAPGLAGSIADVKWCDIETSTGQIVDSLVGQDCDVVIYVGMEPCGLLLLGQCVQKGLLTTQSTGSGTTSTTMQSGKLKAFLLSDGCATTNFTEAVANVRINEPIFVVSPVPPLDGGTKAFDYSWYGAQAARLANTLVTTQDPPDRKHVMNGMQDYLRRNKEFSINNGNRTVELRFKNGDSFEFDGALGQNEPRVDREVSRFHIYRLNDGHPSHTSSRCECGYN